MNKPAAWISVGLGVAWVVVGGIQYALPHGPLPRGVFLVLGVIYLISAAFMLKRAYRA